MSYDIETINMMLDTANRYAEMYRKDGNTDVIPAIGRIVGLIEREGYKVEATPYKFALAKGGDADA